MFASQGKYLLQNMNIVLLLLVPVLLFFIINFLLGQFIGRMMHLSYKDTVSLSLTTLARNSPVALAIAVTAFPDEPLIALALVIGPLIELPVLAFVSQVLLLIKKNGNTHNKTVPFWDGFYGKITYNTCFLFINTNEITETTNVIIPIVIK